MTDSADMQADQATAKPDAETAWYSPLAHVDFRFLLAGVVFMSAGQWIQQVTLGWLVYGLTGSSVLLGALNGARMLPFLFVAPAAGVAADRMDRRKLLLLSQVVLMITATGMGGLVISGRVEVWHVFAFTLITGGAWAFNEPLRQALIPSVVPRSDLPGAVALNSTASQFTKMIAPSVGGFLIAWVGAGGNLLVQAASYLGVFAMFYLMRPRPLPPRTHHSSVAGDLAVALRYIVSSPLILAVVSVSLVSRIFAMPYQSMMPVFQKDVYAVGPEGLGILMGAPAVGATVATLLLTASASRLHHRGLLLVASLSLQGLLLTVFSQAQSLLPAVITLVGVGFFQLIFFVLSMTLVQTNVPDALRGRVLSIFMLDHALTPAGALTAGIAIEFVGPQATLAAMGFVVVGLAVLASWAAPQIRGAEV